MQNKFILTILVLVFSGSHLLAQLITKNEKIRLGIGIAGLASDQINNMIAEIETETYRLGPGVNIDPFGGDITFFFEYESEVGSGFAYDLNIQYSSNKTRTDNSDIAIQVRQGLLFDYSIYEFSLDLIYYLPLFKISTSQTSLVFGAGPDIVYVELLSIYYLDQQPAFAQSIRNERNSGLLGARFYTGWNIPYVESLSFQFRLGYIYRPEKKIPGKTEELLIDNTAIGQEKMDTDFFESFDTYNLSQYWITFSVAYGF